MKVRKMWVGMLHWFMAVEMAVWFGNRSFVDVLVVTVMHMHVLMLQYVMPEWRSERCSQRPKPIIAPAISKL